MGVGVKAWLTNRLVGGLTAERDTVATPLCDFERVRYDIRPGDVLLVEGRSRISDVIRLVTQTPWTHAALYIGRLHDIDDRAVRDHIAASCGDTELEDQLLIEALLGVGTIVSALGKYRDANLRICRPTGLARHDAQTVIAYASRHLGCDYDTRQLLDLARFLFPYGILPRRWRSSLFTHNAGAPTRTVCSSMIASAFSAVRFPVLPVIGRDSDGTIRLHRRNHLLFTPRDFDYSPYFEIIKCPYMGFEDRPIYSHLPWDEQGRICDGEEDWLNGTAEPVSKLPAKHEWPSALVSELGPAGMETAGDEKH